MELIRASDTRNILAPVLDWNIEKPDPEKGSVTSRLTKECVSVFRKLLKRLSQEEGPSREILRRLERSCSSLVLWESGYGVVDGGLDDVLAKSRTLRRSTLEYLLNISRALAHRLPPLIDGGDEKLGSRTAVLNSVVAEAETSMHEGYQDGSDGDDSDSDGSSVSLSGDWDEIAEDLQTDVQCLLDLGPLIKSPAADPVQLSQGDQQTPEKWNPHVVYGDSIRVRFPKADPALVDRLARANLERFLKGRADREKNQSAGDTAVPAGTAETVAPYTEPVSKFHDSGLGTSLNTGSAYAETVMSYHRKDGEPVRIPPLPEEARKGKPFECVACGRSVVMKTTSAWKKHLFRDLRPWICHDLHCNFGLFQSREDWVQHLGLQHGLDPEWKSFACPICNEDTGDGMFSITRHLSIHMEEISLNALPGGVEPDEISGSGTDDASTTDTVSQVDKDSFGMTGFKITDLGADRRPSLSPQFVPDGFPLPSTAGSWPEVDTAEEQDTYQFNCICGCYGDDGKLAFCEACHTLQHIECFYPDNVEEALQENFSHLCHECEPRTLDRVRASKRMLLKVQAPQYQDRVPFQPPLDWLRPQQDHHEPYTRHTAEDWDPYKKVVRMLLFLQNRTYQEVVRILHDDYQFKTSFTQLKQKLDEWGFGEIPVHTHALFDSFPLSEIETANPIFEGTLRDVCLQHGTAVNVDGEGTEGQASVPTAAADHIPSELRLPPIADVPTRISAKLLQTEKHHGSPINDFANDAHYLAGIGRWCRTIDQNVRFDSASESRSSPPLAPQPQPQLLSVPNQWSGSQAQLEAISQTSLPSAGVEAPLPGPDTKSSGAQPPPAAATARSRSSRTAADPSSKSGKNGTRVRIHEKERGGEIHADMPRYCYCNSVSYGTMISCYADGCEMEWFHLECAGLKEPPKTNVIWFCDHCEIDERLRIIRAAREGDDLIPQPLRRVRKVLKSRRARVYGTNKLE